MHYCSVFFHSHKDDDMSELMSQFHCDNEEISEFQVEVTASEALKLYKKLSKEEKKVCGDIEGYFASDGYTKNNDGDYGYFSNPNACYDWFQIGGRYNGILIPKGIKPEKMKEIQDNDLSNKWVWRSKMKDYLRLRAMSPFEYCADQQKLGESELKVSKLDIEVTLKYNQSWTKIKHAGQLFHNYFCEEDGYIDKDNKEFDRLLEKYKDGYMTVIDYHY